MKYRTVRTEEFCDWLLNESLKAQVQIEKRISNIETDGHFGIIKEDLVEGVCELKWKNGRRVYYAYLLEDNILLLLGGNKNGQNYDIKQAQKILKEYTEYEA
jgi:putative addiction module killer protein